MPRLPHARASGTLIELALSPCNDRPLLFDYLIIVAKLLAGKGLAILFCRNTSVQSVDQVFHSPASRLLHWLMVGSLATRRCYPVNN